jgi:regulatory protein
MRAALWMLSRRALSEGEIRERLSKKGFPETDASGVVRRLRELGLADDPKLCDHLVRSFRDTRGYGPVKIAWALRARRFPPGLVEEVLRNSSSGEEELSAASAALKKKFRDRLPPGRDGAARAYRFLAGRGFPPDTCRKAVGSLFADIKEGEE